MSEGLMNKFAVAVLLRVLFASAVPSSVIATK